MTVEAEFDLRQRHYEVEVKGDIFQALRRRAEHRHVPVEEVIERLLRNDLLPSRAG